MTLLSDLLEQGFRDPALLQQALTHKSYHNENLSQSTGHNERLEFLGDAVLDLALTDILMREFPTFTEGGLSKIRASLVNEGVLAELARVCQLDQKMRLGRGESLTGGSTKPRLLASVFEAFVGAYYLDAGFEKALELIKEIFRDRINQLDHEVHFSADYKTRLQERLQEQHRQAPCYVMISETGPDHDKTFVVAVKLGEKELARGEGRSKKQAEQNAARQALEEEA